MSVRTTLLSLGLLLGLGLPAAAVAQGYPDRPVKIVVPWTPGGAVDILARVLAPPLSEILGQPVVIENRAGANSMIGSAIVAQSPPDGYTLLIDNLTGHAINPSFHKKMAFNSLKDFAPVGLLTSVTNLLVVHPSAKVKTLGDVIAEAKANPGKLTYASSGNGGYAHLATEMFSARAGVQMIHVPYKGAAPALADVMGGGVYMMIVTLPSVLQQVSSGRLTAIASTGTERSPSTPNVPTMIESGMPDFAVATWYGALFPAGTPEPIVDKLNRAFRQILANPQMQARLTELGFEMRGSSPAELARHLSAETDSWGKLVKQLGIQAD